MDGKVLVLGATGLIGRHVLGALRRAGYAAIGVSRRRPAGETASGWRELDFGSLLTPQDWLPQLDGVTAVVNCVGIIRESRAGDFERLHHGAPVALFAACEQLAVRRVVHISALGSAPDAATPYWRSKGAADADLWQRRLSACVLRPSLVYGDDGASSILFRTLATLPVLWLPEAQRAQVQPIHVEDLSALVLELVREPGVVPPLLAAVGPRAMRLVDYLGALRSGMGGAAGKVMTPPRPLARLAARVAGLHPASALTPAALIMLEHSAQGGNTADAAPAQGLLALQGRTLRDPLSFATPAQLPGATLAWGLPLLTMAMAVLWLITAYVSWFVWPHAQSAQWLAACGIDGVLAEPVLLLASLLDAGIGVLLLVRPQRWLWGLQLALVAGYTAVMSICLPAFWSHPFGPLSKNLPLMALMAVLWRLDSRKG